MHSRRHSSTAPSGAGECLVGKAYSWPGRARLESARSDTAPVLGFNYKDRPQAAAQWLDRHGDPYSQVVVDLDGRIGLDYGVYGVPETFLIDRAGIIRYKKIGPLTQADVVEDILPLIEELNR